MTRDQLLVKTVRCTKMIAALGVLSLALSGCGGGDDHAVTLLNFSGNVSGTDCLSGFVLDVPVRYSITIEDLSAGGRVTLRDHAGITWTGSMTTSSSFNVSNSADPRMSIVVSDITPAGAHVLATTACVSFRCCATLSGELRS